MYGAIRRPLGHGEDMAKTWRSQGGGVIFRRNFFANLEILDDVRIPLKRNFCIFFDCRTLYNTRPIYINVDKYLDVTCRHPKSSRVHVAGWWAM